MATAGDEDGVGEVVAVGDGVLLGVLVTDGVPLGVLEGDAPDEGVGVVDTIAVPLMSTGTTPVECDVDPPHTFMRMQNPGASSPAPPGTANVLVFMHEDDVWHICTFPSCTNAPFGPPTPKLNITSVHCGTPPFGQYVACTTMFLKPAVLAHQFRLLLDAIADEPIEAW